MSTTAKPSRTGAGVPSISAESPFSPRRWWYELWHFLSRILAIGCFDYRIFTHRSLPVSGGCLLASNHQSFLDPWLVGLCHRRDVFFLARDSLFRFRPFGWFIASLNAVPVARESVAPRQGIETCLAVLRQGRGLVIFPEGTRTADGSMGPLKRGIRLIARQSGVPVLPVLVDGAFEVWPRGRLLPRGGPVRVFAGTPIRIAPSGGAAEGDLAGEPGGGETRGRPAERLVPAGAFMEALEEAYRELRKEAARHRARSRRRRS